MRYILYNPTTKQVTEAYDNPMVRVYRSSSITRDYNTAPEDVWADILAHPTTYTVDDSTSFRLVKSVE